MEGAGAFGGATSSKYHSMLIVLITVIQSQAPMPNNGEDEKTLQYKIGDLPLHSSVSQRLVSVCIPSASTPGQLDSFLDVQNRSRIMEHPLSQGPHSVQ